MRSTIMTHMRIRPIVTELSQRTPQRTPHNPELRITGVMRSSALRLDRLEAAERSRSRLIWIILGAAVTLAVTAVWRQIFGG